MKIVPLTMADFVKVMEGRVVLNIDDSRLCCDGSGKGGKYRITYKSKNWNDDYEMSRSASHL